MSILVHKRNAARNTPECRVCLKVANKEVPRNRNAVISEICEAMCEADRKNYSRGVFKQLMKLTSKIQTNM